MSDKGITASFILETLQKLQSEGNSVYPKGIFPSQRYHPFLPYKREDDNLFFTVSVVHILQGIASKLTSSEKQIAEQIIEAAKRSFSLFRNKDGLDTFNFWQTTPSRHFPNGRFMHRFKHFQIPDDVDDTSLVFLTKNASKERVGKLREKLKNHANLAYRKAFNPFSKYQHLKVYSTFFGEKMYLEFDICVLSNLMRLILTHFPNEPNEYDSDTLHFITEVIANKEHLFLPFYSAPNYPAAELILYHVARLIPVLPNGYRQKIEPQIVADLKRMVSQSNGMKRILLENSLLKLGCEASSIHQNVDKLASDKDFFFFHAGMITAFENNVAQHLAKFRVFHLRYRCEALNWVLLLQNRMLRKS